MRILIHLVLKAPNAASYMEKEGRQPSAATVINRVSVKYPNLLRRRKNVQLATEVFVRVSGAKDFA